MDSIEFLLARFAALPLPEQASLTLASLLAAAAVMAAMPRRARPARLPQGAGVAAPRLRRAAPFASAASA